MKIVIINGSARRGNTLTAIDAFVKGASEKNEIEIIQPDRLHIAPCKGCGACQCYKGCIDQDDTNPTIDKITAADMILFATPVYWWGMSAQLKLIIDKCYCRGLQLKNKKVGTIVVGGSPVDSIQYELIDLLNSYLPCVTLAFTAAINLLCVISLLANAFMTSSSIVPAVIICWTTTVSADCPCLHNLATVC